jgi:hypothetical protein
MLISWFCTTNIFHFVNLDKPISDDYFPRMDKAVLSISGNVYKQQEMEIDKLIYDA